LRIGFLLGQYWGLNSGPSTFLESGPQPFSLAIFQLGSFILAWAALGLRFSWLCFPSSWYHKYELPYLATRPFEVSLILAAVQL
jgi:hypothetical protein